MCTGLIGVDGCCCCTRATGTAGEGTRRRGVFTVLLECGGDIEWVRSMVGPVFYLRFMYLRLQWISEACIFLWGFSRFRFSCSYGLADGPAFFFFDRGGL